MSGRSVGTISTYFHAIRARGAELWQIRARGAFRQLIKRRQCEMKYSPLVSVLGCFCCVFVSFSSCFLLVCRLCVFASFCLSVLCFFVIFCYFSLCFVVLCCPGQLGQLAEPAGWPGSESMQNCVCFVSFLFFLSCV